MRFANGFALALVWASVWGPGPAAVASPPPISLHPGNPHYFLWRGRSTVLVTSAEHYGAVLNLDFDYVRYLGELQRKGLNLTRTFSGTYVELPHSFGITDNTLSPKASRYVTPWVRSVEPGNADRGWKFDLTQWDLAYFQRLKGFMTAASKAGVVVELTLFCTLYEDALWDVSPMQVENNINGVGTCPRQEVFKLMHDDLTAVQVALTRKVVQELRDFDNLIYEVCNEPYIEDCVSREWQHRVVDTIVEEEAKLGVRHLISMNIANNKARVVAPHPDVQVLNFHYAYPPDVVAMNADLNRAVGDNETGFSGKEDFPYRREGWAFMLAGGALFNHLDWSFTPPHPEGDFVAFESPGGGGPTIRKQVSILKRFVESFDFVRMQPSASLATAVSKEVRIQVLAEPGVGYAVYVHAPAGGGPMQAGFDLDMPAGTYSVEWMDPKTGVRTSGEAIPHAGGACRLKTPTFVEDIALAVRKTSESE